MPDTKFGTFYQLLDTMTPEMREIAIALKAMILAVDSNAVEVVRMGDRAATYGVGPKKMTEGYTYILPHAKWVNLGFFQGAFLPDPTGLLEGAGAKMRHVKIRNLETCRNPAIREMLATALKERKAALGRE